ncbi:MAG: NAD(P)/FAD-dependent oxidoreductase [Promethearchaeota archaeon]
MEYDIVIVGGGFAGLATAITASRNDASCLVVEKEKELGYPVHTSGGSWYNEMLQLGLDESLLHPIYSIAFHSPTGEVVSASFKDQDPPYGCIIDVRGTIQFLAMNAAKEGAHILPNTKALSPILENGEIIGVNIRSSTSGTKKVYSKIVVDASGSVSLITRRLGLKEGKWQRYGIGAEYEAYVPLPAEYHVDFILGKKYAPAGYAWVFPTGKDRARIGVGIIRPDSQKNPFDYLEVIMRRHPNVSKYLKHAVPVEYHHGIFPCEGPLPKTVQNRFISVGDAAGHGSPLVGEGIRYALQFGYLAGEIAANAIMENDLSENYLMQFEFKWKKQIETNYKIALQIQKRLAGYSDEDWERKVSMLKALDFEKLVVFLNKLKGNL